MIVIAINFNASAIENEKNLLKNPEHLNKNFKNSLQLKGKELYALTIAWQHFLNMNETKLMDILGYDFKAYSSDNIIEIMIITRKIPNTDRIQIGTSGIFDYKIDPNNFKIISITAR